MRIHLALPLLALGCAFAGAAVAEPIPYSKTVQQFCAADYKKFCGEYGLESTALRSCMDRNGESLSPSCVKTSRWVWPNFPAPTTAILTGMRLLLSSGAAPSRQEPRQRVAVVEVHEVAVARVAGNEDHRRQVAVARLALDRAAAAHPNPGRTATIRRLTRTEYQNAIRDLLALDVDVASLLPADDSSYGFDNVTVGTTTSGYRSPRP